MWHAVSSSIDLFLCSEEQETPLCLLAIFVYFCCLAIKGLEYLFGDKICLKPRKGKRNVSANRVFRILVGNTNQKDISEVLCTLQYLKGERLMSLPDKRLIPCAYKSHTVEINLYCLLPPLKPHNGRTTC